MKKALLATVLALGVVDAAYASQYVTPWFEGNFTCRIAGSSDLLAVAIRTSSVPNTNCQGDRCSTSGYRMVVSPRANLTSWPRSLPGVNVYHTDSYIHFYMEMKNSNAMVQLQKKRVRYRVIYTGKYIRNGQTWQLTCTK